jgi:hypothetical protein
MSDLTDLYAALDSAKSTIAFSSQDWAASRDFAWLYGILLGWDGDPAGGDVDQDNAMALLAARHGWTDEDVALLRRLHAAVAGFDLNRVGDLEGAR